MIRIIRGAPPTRAAGRRSPGSWWTSRCTSASRRWSCFTGSGRSAAAYLETQFPSWLLFSAQGDSPMMEKAPLGNNLRPRQPLNNRAVRTNIALSRQKVRQWDKHIHRGWAVNLIFRITRVSCARRSCPVWCTPPMTGYTASTPILASSPCLTLHSAHCHRKIHIFWLLRRARILNITLTMKGSTLLWSPSFYDNNNHYISIVIELQTLFNTSRSNLLIVKLSWKSWLDLLTGPGEQGGPLEFRTLEQLLANFDKYQISRLNLKTRHPTDKIKIIIKKSR